MREGRVELTVGSGARRVVVALLHPGDVEGDIQLLLAMPAPYAARAVDDVTLLYLSAVDFDALLASRPAVSRRWTTSIATRTSHCQMRIVDLLSAPQPVQTARLLLAAAASARTCGSWGSGGWTRSLPNGRALWRRPWNQSRPSPRGARPP